MTQGFIVFVFGVEREKALAQKALPEPDSSNKDDTRPFATNAPAELVGRFAPDFYDFGIFGLGGQRPTVVGYPVVKPIARTPDSQVTSWRLCRLAWSEPSVCTLVR